MTTPTRSTLENYSFLLNLSENGELQLSTSRRSRLRPRCEADLRSSHRYIVAFRSTRAPNSVSRDLYEADRLAHEEAVSVRSAIRPQIRCEGARR